MGEEGGGRGPGGHQEDEGVTGTGDGPGTTERHVRPALDGLYRLSAGLAAFCLAAIAALVVIQVTGRLLGILVPGADDLAGYALMASTFLALASTLRAGVHIRVTLLVRHSSPADGGRSSSGASARGRPSAPISGGT